MALFYGVILLIAMVLAAPDWTDICPSTCRCKWASGKKTAVCKQGGFIAIPDSLDSDMQVLDLSSNSIMQLPKDAFKATGLVNLQRIFLQNSGIMDIHSDAFRDLTILVDVDLSHNSITKLNPDTFRGNERLRVVYLSHNPLKKLVKEQFPFLPHLRILELEDCQLEDIHNEAFMHLIGLESLNLKHNFLRNLSESAFMNFAQLKTLLLEGNPWHCDCNLRGFRNWLLSSNLYSVSQTCSEPEKLQEHSWEEIDSQEFACAPKVSIWPQNQVQVEAGGNVTFGCRITGDPEPQISWLYEGYPINHTWLILEVEEGLLDKWANVSVYNVSEIDVGVYTCEAKNLLDVAAMNLTVVLPEVVTATTLSKADAGLILWWGLLIISVTLVSGVVFAVGIVCCVRHRMSSRSRRRNMKASVSFTDQEKKLLDVSIATTTDRGVGSSCEAIPEESIDPPVHITIESEPLPMAVYPPPPEFSGGGSRVGVVGPPPMGPYGNIFISVSLGRDPRAALLDASTRCPDLLDLPPRKQPFHGMATLPRRPPQTAPKYDNMGPRVTAGGSSTLSLPGEAAPAPTARPQLPPPPPPPTGFHPQLTPEFVSL